MTDASMAVVISSVSTLVVTVVKMVLDYKERSFDRAERIRVAGVLADHTSATAGMVAKKIDENTVINVAALDAANGITEKIRAEGLQLRGHSRHSDHEHIEPERRK